MTEPHDVNRSSAAGFDDVADGDWVRDLLTEQAATVRPHAAPVGQVVRRARRARHRRTSVAVGAGLAAAATVAGVVVVDRSATDDRQQVEAGLADAAEEGTPDGSTGPSDATSAPSSTVLEVPVDIPALASGAPLRLGLDVEGAEVTTVTDNPAEDGPTGGGSGSGATMLEGSDGRKVLVMVRFPGEAPVSDSAPPPWYGAVEETTVDLGGGVAGTISRMPEATSGVPDLAIAFERNGAELGVYGYDVPEAELVEVARGLEVAANPALLVTRIPEDMRPAEWFDPTTPWFGIRSSIAYLLPGRGWVAITVASRADATFEADLASVRSAPSAARSIRTVRGVDAIVEDANGSTSIRWREPSGNLVSMSITPAADAPSPPDVSLVDSLVELDEATFQDLVAAHPAP